MAAVPFATEMIVPSKRFVSPMKVAANRLAGLL